MPAKLKTFRALFAFDVDEPDELELQPGDLVDVAVQHDGEWGVGVSRRTQKQGSFPWSYVEELKDTDSRKVHELEIVDVLRPWFCFHCTDVIWPGPGRQAYKCSKCAFWCHKTCKFFVENNSSLECPEDASTSSMPAGPATLDDWGVDDVRLWIYAVKLEVYDPEFTRAAVDGKALKQLTAGKLQSMGITDQYHVEIVLASIHELVEGRSTMMEGDFGERTRNFRSADLDGARLLDLVPLSVPSEKHLKIVKGHKFKVKTFLHPTWCDTSRKYLWGLARQGYQCVVCGYNTHRWCEDLVPHCTASSSIIAPEQPGSDLCRAFGLHIDQVVEGNDAAPGLVIDLISAMDKAGIDTPDLYTAKVKPSEIRDMMGSMLTSGKIDVSANKPVVLAGLMKEYFNELPDPLCPSDSYDKLIAATALPGEAAQAAEIDLIVATFPDPNQRTLRTLLKHFARVVQSQGKNNMSPEVLAKAWSAILVRAPGQLTFQNLFNREAHDTIVYLLTMKCSCGARPDLSGEAPPPIVPRKRNSISQGTRPRLESNYANISELLKKSSKSTGQAKAPPRPAGHSRATSGSASNKALEKFPWYAGPMDRPAAEKAMENLIDGAFLIRASQSRRGYSLTVKFREIRHVVIVESKGKYGFSEPTTFDSLPDLIKHFERVSLACYNAELETTLAHPYKTAPQQKAVEVEVFDAELTEELYISNVSALRESIDRQARDLRYTQRMAASYSTRVKELQRDLKAQEEILTMLLEQKKLHEGFHAALGEADKQAVMSNYSMLKARIVEADKAYQAVSRQLRTEKEKEDKAIKRTQTQRGSQADTKGPRAPRAVSKAVVAAVPNPAESKFYIGTTPRAEAEKMLEGLPDGTFLVRHSDRPRDPYTLSLRFQSQTKHIQIKYDGTRFGLAEPLAFFSLEGLCEYYKKEKLSSTISTRLARPVKEPY